MTRGISDSESCLSCRYYAESANECRRHSPTVVCNGAYSVFPKTGPHLWCGDYLVGDMLNIVGAVAKRDDK